MPLGGSNSSAPLASFEEQRQSNAKYFRIVSINKTEINDATAILLLHQNAQERRRAISYKVNQLVTDELLAKIQAEVHDAVVVVSINANVNHKLMFLGQNKQTLNPLVWPNVEDLVLNFGYSKCDSDKKLFNPQGFKYAPKSPQIPNYCDPLVKYLLEESEFMPQFGPFIGRMIGTQALQLTINLIRAILYEAITSFYQQNLLFTCGFKTFRKILKLEDYKFGKINHRDAVLLNPDKVAWRGRYLRRIRQNDQHQNYTVIYLDETWADTHAVIEKSWVRSCYASLQERRDFSLRNYKPGKGRRLIIVAAGNENGSIKESIFVKLEKERQKPKTTMIILTPNRFESGFLIFLIRLTALAQKNG
ncbi:unnamed protein product [Allacma fusca]|uniref:Uncharacterized protein n=1 Tax=Allacma fusca TaxID=39272 RepID=A0A8J2IXT8_9HEXA|nr:unnamed protein product [Allacma fusca]